jgi:hypothetical protein
LVEIVEFVPGKLWHRRLQADPGRTASFRNAEHAKPDIKNKSFLMINDFIGNILSLSYVRTQVTFA